MNRSSRVLTITASFALLIPVCGFGPNSGNGQAVGAGLSVDVIVTAAPIYEPLAVLRGASQYSQARSGERFPHGAQLLWIHQGIAEPLLPGFAASADANLSFDGLRVLFAGKKSAVDPWQIWELTLADHSLRQVIATPTDAVRPFYLPGGRLVWAQRTPHGFQIESSADGRLPAPFFLNPTADPGVLPLTYMRASAFPTDVLADGRILFEAGFPLGLGSTPEIYTEYADGSGVEAYRCDHGRARWGGMQLASGDVVFTHGASLARFTSPLAHEVSIDAPRAEYDGAMAETAAGDWLLSARPASGEQNAGHYALTLWKPGAMALQTVYAQSGMNLVDPVLLTPRTPPRRHPSGLHPWNYANLMALDARLSPEGDLKVTSISVRLERQDASGKAIITGMAPVAADGSFYVKVPSDQPIRFSLLDKNGAVLRRQRGWFWIRSGEQRICVGCHTGPERSSENRKPEVFDRTTMPDDLTGVNSTGRLPGVK